MGIRQVKLEKVSRRVAGVALAALGGLLLTQAVAVAQQKEIAVMLPAAGDPYFKLKAGRLRRCGKEARLRRQDLRRRRIREPSKSGYAN